MGFASWVGKEIGKAAVRAANEKVNCKDPKSKFNGVAGVGGSS